ncbi:MAG: hypothetical protein IJX11_05630 [Bacteroidales bacterium]|nr:hypothetical protein [Bacteroidales bacterium]
MKRIILSIAILLGMAAMAAAQPRSAGLRIGATGLDAVYQHSITQNHFAEGNVGLDFGSDGRPGFRVSGTYNFIFARPAWTDQGTWAIYAGPGITLGGVSDKVTNTIGNVEYKFADSGFMFAIAAQVGLEYTFEFPLQLAVDLRPCFGIHANDGKFRDSASGIELDYGSKVGFYNRGLMGFIPTVSVKYRF